MQPADTPAILIVDDISSIRTVLRHILGTEGFAVYEAGTGRAALQLAQGRSIDLVLIDAHMPDWDGPQTVRAFREAFPEAPTRYVVMTGDPTTLPETLDVHHPACLVHRIIAKPFRPATLLEFIRQELLLRGASRPTTSGQAPDPAPSVWSPPVGGV